MGAWIETFRTVSGMICAVVAPLVGAWIETYSGLLNIPLRIVAPLVGAWIETGRISWLMQKR